MPRKNANPVAAANVITNAVWARWAAVVAGDL